MFGVGDVHVLLFVRGLVMVGAEPLTNRARFVDPTTDRDALVVVLARAETWITSAVEVGALVMAVRRRG